MERGKGNIFEKREKLKLPYRSESKKENFRKFLARDVCKFIQTDAPLPFRQGKTKLSNTRTPSFRMSCPLLIYAGFSLKRGLLTLLFHVARQLDCENTRFLFSKAAFLGDHVVLQWRIQGRGPGGPALPLILDQTEARRDEKNFFKTAPPYLKVRIRHCFALRITSCMYCAKSHNYYGS